MKVQGPVRSDHRYIAAIFKNRGMKVGDRDLEVVSKAFQRAGGSWENIIKGSVPDIQLLKKIVKIAIKTGSVKSSG